MSDWVTALRSDSRAANTAAMTGNEVDNGFWVKLGLMGRGRRDGGRVKGRGGEGRPGEGGLVALPVAYLSVCLSLSLSKPKSSLCLSETYV